MTTHFPGLRDHVAARENGAAPVYQPGASAGNREAAGYQPAASNEQSAPTSKEERGTLMSSITSTAAPASTLPEQAVTASLTVEIMHDLDDGQPTLVAYTEGNAGDLREVAVTALAVMVREARAKLDQIEQLARDYATKVTIPLFLKHFDIELHEYKAESMHEDFGPELTAQIRGISEQHKDGRIIFAVPEGQDPIQRLAALRNYVNDMRSQADAA